MCRVRSAARLVVVSTVLTAAVALSGCGAGSSGDTGGLPTYTGSPSGGTTSAPSSSASASTTPAPDPSPWTALPTISKGPNKGVHQGSLLASSVAKTPEEKAAAEVYVAFWKTIAKAGYHVKVPQAQLDKVSSGRPQTVVRNWVAGLRKKGARTVGWTAIHVTEIDVGERGVLLEGCVDNGSYDVKRKTGKRLEKTPVGYDADATVREVDGRLVVTRSRVVEREAPCPH